MKYRAAEGVRISYEIGEDIIGCDLFIEVTRNEVVTRIVRNFNTKGIAELYAHEAGYTDLVVPILSDTEHVLVWKIAESNFYNEVTRTPNETLKVRQVVETDEGALDSLVVHGIVSRSGSDSIVLTPVGDMYVSQHFKNLVY